LGGPLSRLLPSDPKDELVQTFLGQALAQIDPGVFTEEEAEDRLVRCSGEEDGDHGLTTLHHLADAGTDLGSLPGTQPMVAEAHQSGRNLQDPLLQLVLPGNPGPELILVEPWVQPLRAQGGGDLADDGLVLAVVAEEDVVAWGHKHLGL